MKKKKKALAGAVLLLKSGWGRSLLLAAAIILALAGAAMLRMKEWSQITEDGYVVTEEVADTLKNGMEDPEAEYVDLYPVSAWDGVYSRLGSLYVGEDLQRFLQAYPQILGSGSGVRFLTDSMELIAEDMTTRLSTYDGLRMNGGITFNEDGSQADVENFVLVGLPNGLYLNAQNMELSYASVSTVVPADSIVYFGESEVRCYVRRESELVYQEIGSLMAARIRIGNLDMDYRDFLELLESSSGSGVDVPREEPARWEEIQAVESVVIDSQGGTGGHTEQGGREEGGADSEDQAGTQGSGSASSASQDGAQAGQGSQAGASQDARPRARTAAQTDLPATEAPAAAREETRTVRPAARTPAGIPREVPAVPENPVTPWRSPAERPERKTEISWTAASWIWGTMSPRSRPGTSGRRSIISTAT